MYPIEIHHGFFPMNHIHTFNIYSDTAMSLHPNVLYNCIHVANGMKWYFSSDFCWKFGNESDSVTKSYDTIPNRQIHLIVFVDILFLALMVIDVIPLFLIYQLLLRFGNVLCGICRFTFFCSEIKLKSFEIK